MATRAKSLRYALATLAAGACLVGLPSASTAQDQVEGSQPGLPFVPCDVERTPDLCYEPDAVNKYSWVNAMQRGIAGSTAALQWARVPITLLAANAASAVDSNDQGGADSRVVVMGFFVSPQGSPANYGYSELIPVRTLAFGSLPVEVELQISQLRDGADLPIPIEVDASNRSYLLPYGSMEDFPSTAIDQLLNVGVKSLRIDGVEVQLGSSCMTAEPAHLEVASEPLQFFNDPTILYPGGVASIAEFDPEVGFVGVQGGTFNGKLDVPGFSGCVSQNGDDISGILSSALSSEGNPVSIRVGSLDCQDYVFDPDVGAQVTVPPAPGREVKDLTCTGFYKNLNPSITPVPAPFDIPTSPPVAQP